MAMATVEPFGDAAADVRHGMATSVLANVNRDPKRVPKPYQMSDFIPWAKQPEPEGPISLDPESQSRLIKQSLFKHQG